MSAYTGSEAYSGAGSVLSVDTSATSTPSFVVINEVMESSLSGRSARTVECTNFSSGLVSEFLSVIVDSGVISLRANYLPADAGQAQLSTSFSTLKKTKFTLLLPKSPAQSVAGDLYSFSAIVQEFSFSVDVQKQITLDCKLKISGNLSLTPGS